MPKGITTDTRTVYLCNYSEHPHFLSLSEKKLFL
jgi:hypothetical protein